MITDALPLSGAGISQDVISESRMPEVCQLSVTSAICGLVLKIGRYISGVFLRESQLAQMQSSKHYGDGLATGWRRVEITRILYQVDGKWGSTTFNS